MTHIRTTGGIAAVALALTFGQTRANATEPPNAPYLRGTCTDSGNLYAQFRTPNLKDGSRSVANIDKSSLELLSRKGGAKMWAMIYQKTNPDVIDAPDVRTTFKALWAVSGEWNSLGPCDEKLQSTWRPIPAAALKR